MPKVKNNIIKNGVHSHSSVNIYVEPEDPLIKRQLERFQDRKLGLMMHWSPGCQLGTYESWCICDDSAEWSQKDIDWVDDMNEFRKQYWNLNRSFNPVRFQPDVWADLAYECGFKYLLFTTKHHDGFCMWDTKTTDYKITSPDCPFSVHKYADICKYLFDAFRKRGLGIHAYFSKPDWHSKYYWTPEFYGSNSKTQRNVNYNIAEHPELWQKFVQYVHNQITELMTDYGRIDVLWLDGGWVNPANQDQDVRIDKIVRKIRSTTQPHLLVADRTVGGEFENFITPEQTIPSKPILVPWESCITMGSKFAFHYDDIYKTPREIIHMLIDIVAKGGNLALNIAPQPDGRLPKKGVSLMKELGAFLKTNGEAIYGTRVCEPYRVDNLAFTRKDQKVYVFYLYNDDDSKTIQEIHIPLTGDIKDVRMISDNLDIKINQIDGKFVLKIPQRHLEKAPYTDVFCIQF